MAVLMLIGAFAALAASAPQEATQAPARTIVQSFDPDAVGRCLNGLARVRDVRMRCIVDDQGRGRLCEILNPSPAIMRREYVFQCMASRIRFNYADGTPAVGEEVFLNLGGQTVLDESELRREREAQGRSDR